MHTTWWVWREVYTHDTITTSSVMLWLLDAAFLICSGAVETSNCFLLTWVTSLPGPGEMRPVLSWDVGTPGYYSRQEHLLPALVKRAWLLFLTLSLCTPRGGHRSWPLTQPDTPLDTCAFSHLHLPGLRAAHLVFQAGQLLLSHPRQALLSLGRGLVRLAFWLPPNFCLHYWNQDLLKSF